MDKLGKEKLVQELKDKFTKANAAFLTEYRGMDVAAMSALRQQLNKGEGTLKVIKNRIAKIAAKGTAFETFSQKFQGPVAVAFSFKDPVAIAKAILDHTGKESPLKLISGSMDAKELNESDINALSKLPDRQTLLGMTATVLSAVPRNFACVLAAVPRDFVNVLSAVKDQKGKQ